MAIDYLQILGNKLVAAVIYGSVGAVLGHPRMGAATICMTIGLLAVIIGAWLYRFPKGVIRFFSL